MVFDFIRPLQSDYKELASHNKKGDQKMAQEIKMINPLSGGEVAGYKGFSWTTLFFGGLPALFRGHISAFFAQ